MQTITLQIDENKITDFLEAIQKMDFVKNVVVKHKMTLTEKEAKLSPSQKKAWADLKEGLQDVKEGKTRPFRDFLKELDAEEEN